MDLRDPTRAIVAAATNAATGLLPSHLGGVTPAGQLQQSWLWCAGSSALNALSSGDVTVTQFSRDAARR